MVEEGWGGGFFFSFFFLSLSRDARAEFVLLKSRDKHVLCGLGRAAERSPESQSQLSKCIPEMRARRKNVRAVISEQLQVNGVCAKPSAKERLEWPRVRAARSILAEAAPEVQSAADLKWH